MSTTPPQPPRKKPFRWGANDPDHPGMSWWGRWVVRRKPGPPPGPPPAQKPPAPPS